MRSRAHISFKTKLAAALCQLLREDESGCFAPIIPHDDAVRMSEEQIISLFAWDHYPVPHAHGGPDAHYNLQPLLISEHRTKTAKVDVPQIAKTKRVARAHSEFCARALGIVKLPKEKRSRFPKGRKMPSRQFVKRRGVL